MHPDDDLDYDFKWLVPIPLLPTPKGRKFHVPCYSTMSCYSQGDGAGKGKGKVFGKYRTRQLDIEPPIFEELRQRRGEPWNRRGRRNPAAVEVSNADYEAWRQDSGSLDRRSRESSHSSMPALLTDEPAEDSEEDDAAPAEPVRNVEIEVRPDGSTVVHT